MARPKRKERELEQRRRAIVRAAAGVFARQGFAATSMQEIASSAGYGASSLYAYFANKQAILEAVIGSVVDEAPALYDVVIPDGLTLRQKLELLLHHQFAWTEEHRDAFLFLLQRRSSAIAHQNEPDLLSAHVHRMGRWFGEHATPEDSPLPPETLAVSLTGLALAWFHQWIRDGGQGSYRQYVTPVLDMFLDGATGANPPRQENA